jgi:hypothetical protein
MGMADSSKPSSSNTGVSTTAAQNYFLLSEQPGFGAARFSRESRSGLFSNSPLLATGSSSDKGSKPSLQPVESITLDIAIKKESIKFVKVADSSNTYLLEFDFDADVDGFISIFYIAEEISDTSNKTLKFETTYPARTLCLFSNFFLAQNHGLNGIFDTPSVIASGATKT